MDDIKVLHLKSNAQKLETWVAMLNGEIIGHNYLEREDNKKMKFLDAWVHQDHRRKGVYRVLWETRWEYVKKHFEGWTAYAWCKPSSLPLLLENDFISGETSTYVEKLI